MCLYVLLVLLVVVVVSICVYIYIFFVSCLFSLRERHARHGASVRDNNIATGKKSKNKYEDTA